MKEYKTIDLTFVLNEAAVEKGREKPVTRVIPGINRAEGNKLTVALAYAVPTSREVAPEVRPEKFEPSADGKVKIITFERPKQPHVGTPIAAGASLEFPSARRPAGTSVKSGCC